jgi:Protein of unknown function (DUF1194)
MRWYASVGIALVAAALMGGDVASVAAPGGPTQLAQTKSEANVDVELVLAVDVSYSMDLDELELQREGYAAAITSVEFMKALRTGPHGKVAITYFEWASAFDQKVIVPWRVIDGPESADAVASEIRKAPIRRASRTSISGAIMFGTALFDQNPNRGIRKVIDVSGDGPNNNGPVVGVTREAALAKGIVINGLPVMVKQTSYATMDIEHLDYYYEDCVIGGPGSFVIPIKNKGQFQEAIRTKLVMEVADLAPRVVPVQGKKARVSCTAGEDMWQQRWGR